MLALVKFYPLLEPECTLRHELHELSESCVITFTSILEEATDFAACGDGSLLEARSCQPCLQRVLPSLLVHSRRSPDGVGCSSR